MYLLININCTHKYVALALKLIKRNVRNYCNSSKMYTFAVVLVYKTLRMQQFCVQIYEKYYNIQIINEKKYGKFEK